MRNVLGKILFFGLMSGACLPASLAQSGSTCVSNRTTRASATAAEWYSNSNFDAQRRHFRSPNARGATATLSFTGTGVTWIGACWTPGPVSQPPFVDGTMYVVDTYGIDTSISDRSFSDARFAPRPHTLSIEVTHTRDGNAKAPGVDRRVRDLRWNRDHGRVSAPPGVARNGTPQHCNTAAGSCMNTPMHSRRQCCSFSGSRIECHDQFQRDGHHVDRIPGRVVRDSKGHRGWDCGCARRHFRVSGGSPGNRTQNRGSQPGNHTVTIEVTRTRSPDSKGAWIWMDAFDVIGP